MAERGEAELLAEWEEAAASKRLLLQRCEACGAAQAYVRTVCAACQSSAVRFVEAAGRGEIESFTWVHRAAFEGVSVPYAVARVRLTEGALLLSSVVGVEEEKLGCGDPVALRWAEQADGRWLAVFGPTEA